MTKKAWTPAQWQKDPNSIDATLPRVQYWTKGGTMLTAQMPNETAKELVRIGKAFVITGQAINEL